MRAAIIAALLTCLALPAGAQCQGDFNGDGMVLVNELIVAVNNALNGCPTAACPINFSDDNSGNGTTDCFYTGRWNQSCGAADLEARWISDGQFVVVDFQGFTPGLFYAGEVTSPTSATLTGWFQQPDASDGVVDAPGTLTLGNGGGQLVVAPTTPPFMIEGCDFAHYDGNLTSVVGGTTTPAIRSPASIGAAFQRLRAARAARAARPDLQRDDSAK